MSHLLAQVPLTVSPFVSLPTAPTLPYTYRSLPSTLPSSAIELALSSSNVTPSSTADGRPRFIISPSGSAAHPDEIIASCQTLEKHLKQVKQDAESTLVKWEQNIRERELAERRRVAPGYLDSDARILQPERKRESVVQDLMTGAVEDDATTSKIPTVAETRNAGNDLDLAFGSMAVR